MNKRIRVSIQQPALPKYRKPFFKLLSMQDDIDLTVYYSLDDPTLPNITTNSFKSVYKHTKKIKFTRHRTLKWHSPQFCAATKRKTDVLILTWDLHYISLIPAIFRAKMNNIPVILWGHGYSKNESALRLRLRGSVGNLANALIFYDKVTANSYLERGFSKHKLFISPNALDQKNITDAKKYWIHNKEELSLHQYTMGIDPQQTMVYIGRIYPEVQLEIAFLSLKSLKYTYPDIKLIIIGDGEEEVCRLKRVASKLKIGNNIIWAGALYDEKSIAKWMLSSSLFCYPENMGLSIMHAYGYRLPVITSDNWKNHGPEINSFESGVNGLSFKSASSASLTKQLKTIFKDPALRQKLSKGADNSAKEYNIEGMVLGFNKAIQDVFDE